jgi:O-antigen/teichoic acid export membrane protein
MPRPIPAAELTPLLWLGAALPVLLDGVAYQFQANLGVLMLGSQADEAAVAALRVASRAVELVLLINVISMQVLGPMLSAALAREAYDEAQRFVSQSALVAAGLGLAIYAALGVWGEAYLDLFGPGFEEGLAALRILIVAHALSMVAGPTSIMLMMLNRQRLALALTLASLGLNYVLSVLLIPPLGLEGAAIAAAASWVFLKALQLAAILLLSPLDPTPFGIARRLGWRPRA